MRWCHDCAVGWDDTRDGHDPSDLCWNCGNTVWLFQSLQVTRIFPEQAAA